MKDDRIDKLELEIAKIKERNLSVEADKAWEISWVRRAYIAIFTYLAITIYMFVVHIDRPFLNAIVPTVGFMLSTLTLPWLKNAWIKDRLKKG
jgi:hypothetical protein